MSDPIPLGKDASEIAQSTTARSGTPLCRNAADHRLRHVRMDIALWDLRGRREGRPLWEMAGGPAGPPGPIAAASTQFPGRAVLQSVEGYLAAGYNAVKIKVGQPDLRKDVARVSAVRDLIGPEVTFMVDANYGLDVPQAIAIARAFPTFDLFWFEEPIDPDDFIGHADRRSNGMPLAMGENLHTVQEFVHAMRRSKLSLIQPTPPIAAASPAGCAWLFGRRANIPV